MYICVYICIYIYIYMNPGICSSHSLDGMLQIWKYLKLHLCSLLHVSLGWSRSPSVCLSPFSVVNTHLVVFRFNCYRWPNFVPYDMKYANIVFCFRYYSNTLFCLEIKLLLLAQSDKNNIWWLALTWLRCKLFTSNRTSLSWGIACQHLYFKSTIIPDHWGI